MGVSNPVEPNQLVRVSCGGAGSMCCPEPRNLSEGVEGMVMYASEAGVRQNCMRKHNRGTGAHTEPMNGKNRRARQALNNRQVCRRGRACG